VFRASAALCGFCARRRTECFGWAPLVRSFHVNRGKMTQITAPSALPSNTVLNLFEDKEGNFWIGTQTGMARLTRSKVNIVPLPQANDSDFETFTRIAMEVSGSDRPCCFKCETARCRSVYCRGWEASTFATYTAITPGAVGRHRRRWCLPVVGSKGTRWTTKEGLSNNFIRALTQDRTKVCGWLRTTA